MVDGVAGAAGTWAGALSTPARAAWGDVFPLLSWPVGPVSVGVLLAGLLGLTWGSFWNVAIVRLARDGARLRDLVHPPSHCDGCGQRVRAYDNIPVVSWLVLRGRCRDCGAAISGRHPLVEGLGALVAVACYFLVGVTANGEGPALLCGRFFGTFFFVGTLVVLALIDLETMLLPGVITRPAIVAFFVVGQAMGQATLRDAGIGALLGFGAFKALQLGYAAATGREGLGGGDAMLMALVGGFLGWQALPFTVGIGATLGSLVAVPLVVFRRWRAPRALATEPLPTTDVEPNDGVESARIGHVEIPFGPFLVAGALAWLFLSRPVGAWLLTWAEQP